jgi:D-serine deaminase-like pyridoxal phosphate-dependent protein
MIGACGADDIAAAVACPIVGIYPARGEAVLYGGAVHLAKQDEVMPDGRKSFGSIFRPGEGGAPWGGIVEGAYIRSVSQEHGVVVLPPAELDRLRLGDLAFVCPVHSCLAQDLLKGSTMVFEREKTR